MDKNSLKFMLVMALLIFGFMLFRKPPQQPENAETSKENASTEQTLAIDTIKPDKLALLPDIIKMSGVKNDDGSYTYTALDNTTLTLSAQGDSVTGQVSAGGIMLSYADVVNSRYPDAVGDVQVKLSNKAAAHKSLANAIDEAQTYQGFASMLRSSDKTDKPVRLSNDVISLEISPKGGILSKATLTKKYKTYFPEKADSEKIDTADVVVFSPKDNWGYNFTLTTAGMSNVNTRDLYFTPKFNADSTEVTMMLTVEDGKYWGFKYSLPKGDSYLVKMEIVSHDMMGQNGILGNNQQLPFEWNLTMPRQERGRTFEERNSTIFYKRSGHGPNDLGPGSEKKELNDPLQWIAFKNQFFSAIIVPQNSFQGATLDQTALKNDPDFVKQMSVKSILDLSMGKDVVASFNIYIGPNLYPMLKSVDKQIGDGDLDFTRIIPLGWSWLRWINTLIIIPIFNLMSGWGMNYGIIILLLTIFIKIVLFPFTYKSYMSQAKMRLLAPEIKEINDKYPGQENAMTRQQKTMALYSRAGASPMSGCLPMLLQLPILIAMFSFFPSCIELRGQSFLWAQDLAAPDVICTLPFTIPFYGNHVSLFCLLMTVTNIIYTRINMQNQPSSAGMPGMKWMMYLMPVMFLFFFNDYAAALSYYYFLSLLITIVQTYIFRRCVNEDKLRKKMAENAAKPKKKSGFMARLEEAQRKQQAALRQQQQQQNRNRRR